MTEKKENNPFDIYKSYAKMSEEAWAKIWEKTISSESYAAFMGSQLDSYLEFLRTAKDNNEKLMQNLNLPTLEDFARLSSQVIKLEDKIETLDYKLTHILELLNLQENNKNTTDREDN